LLHYHINRVIERSKEQMDISRPCYRFNSAIVRNPSASVVCGLRTNDNGDPDYSRLKLEHEAYVAALESLGIEVTELPELKFFPDSVFVEDPALVFSEGAILLRSGAASRQGETNEISPILQDVFDTVLELPQPGHADGGDILVTPKSVLIGLSKRTDSVGATGLIECLKIFGYNGKIVNTPDGVLHFKTECSLLDEETILVTRRMAQSGLFEGFRKIQIPDGEEPAANVVRINDSVLVSARYQRTIEILEKNGYLTAPVKTVEIEKIDAGLSCMSLRWYRC
jgi:dimethylargininase